MHTLPFRCLAVAVALSSSAVMQAQGDLLYSVTSIDGLLRTVDVASATTINSVQIISTTAANATQCNGMARDPISGRVFALVRFGGSVRSLCTLAPATGVATIIGQTSDAFAGIAFRADGVLFGVTGDGANTPETLFSINPANAQATQVLTFGNGNDGETIAFAPDGFLYHASGLGVPNVDEVFERVDTSANTVTGVPLSGYDYDELLALTSYTGASLIGADFNDDLIAFTSAGNASYLGTLDHSFVKGLVFVPSPTSQAFFRQYGNGCPTSIGAIPILLGSGTPGPGQTVGLHLRGAPTVSFGLLAGGFGTGAVPLPSVQCQVQVVPVFFTNGLFTGGNGEFDLSIALPATFAPLDVYFQVGVIDGAGFVVSNPLQMHAR